MAAGDDTGAAAACPVDHRPRDACPVDHSSSSSSSSNNNKPPEACPVDHKSREVWLSQARAAAAAPSPTARPPPSNAPAPAPSWNPLTWRVPFLSTSSPAQSATQPPTPPPPPPSTRSGHLDEARVVSSIPRAVPSSPSPSPSPSPAAAAIPSNHENETGADAATGNWVYPSEKMFFEALRRKGSAGGPDGARAADMRTVVPIHNAVNERAWREIKAWEAPYCGGGSDVAAGAACPGGPRLESFSGLAAKMSPRARINTWLGYTAPFDRHDWVVDRCGVRVEYVIDFYAGRPGGPAGAAVPQKLNFYLDVRPKLNTWEGVKMRALRALGIV
ncbi:hypothetical protein RB600_003640 [Gaeumannomyces tritici]